jgi:hypothetical protein
VVHIAGDGESVDAEEEHTTMISTVGIHHLILAGLVERNHRQHHLPKFLRLVLLRQAYLSSLRILSSLYPKHQLRLPVLLVALRLEFRFRLRHDLTVLSLYGM